MNPSAREELAAAHETIAQLETKLARLKRGFDPEPLTNPISEEQHRERLSRTRRVKSVTAWMVGAIIWTVLATSFLMYAVVVRVSVAKVNATAGSSAAAIHSGSTSP